MSFGAVLLIAEYSLDDLGCEEAVFYHMTWRFPSRIHAATMGYGDSDINHNNYDDNDNANGSDNENNHNIINDRHFDTAGTIHAWNSILCTIP